MTQAYVSISLQDTITMVENAITSSISGQCIDRYYLNTPCGSCWILTYEKYFIRTSGRLTLTVTIDNFERTTRVHTVGGGGGESPLFKFDWGASDSFEGAAWKALSPYMLR